MSGREASEYAPALPRRFGRYTLLKSMAKGGMGEVFLAKTEGVAGIQKLCVLKTLRRHLQDEPHVLARFLDEARVVVQLSHKNICTVFDVGEERGQLYMAMELVHGRDLRAILKASRDVTGGIGVDVAAYVAIEMLDGLDYAHRLKDSLTGKPLNLVHRDISPHNLMVSQEGEVKLIDFGIAASTVKEIRTMPNIIVGKLAYMAPEQALGEGDIDHRADQFAAAIVLVEAATCERFYPSQKFAELLALAEQAVHRPPAYARLPATLREVLDVALQPDRERRFADCAAFRDALADFQKQRGEHKHARDLRKLMSGLFGGELTAFREEIARIASTESSPVSVAPSSPDAETRVMTIEAQAVDDTSQTVERTVPASSEASSFIGTVETEKKKRTRGPSIFLIAALAAVTTIGVGVLITVATTSEKEHVTPASPPVPVIARAIDAGPAGTVDAGSGSQGAAGAVDAGALSQGAAGALDAGAPSQGAAVDAGTLSQSTDDDDDARATPRTRRISVAKLKALDTVQKLAILRRTCPRSTCARRLLAKSEEIGTLSVDELVSFKQDLDACVLRCP